MSTSLATTLILLFFALVIGGSSYYATDVVQKGVLENLEDSRRVAEMTTMRVADLLVAEAESGELAEAALSRWYARYKYIPKDLDTADMVEYVEGLTRVGFEQFDMHLVGSASTPDFSTYTFEISGLGTYEGLYHVIWHLENNREFYRISNLAIEHVEHVRRNDRAGTETRADMASFKFTLLAYFDGIEGISAPADSLQPIPRGLFSASNPVRDIFNPLVKPPPVVAGETAATEALPANTEGLLDIEQATLTSIIGGEATFEESDGRRTVRVDDRIYLGRIIAVDPANSLVRARLVKGRRVELVTIHLGEELPYRRALGSVQLDPATTDLQRESENNQPEENNQPADNN